MGRRGPKKIFYVCCAIIDNNCIQRSIEAETSTEAIALFFKEFKVHPTGVEGPFYRKRETALDYTQELHFSDKRFKAIYGEWIVNASVLLNIEGHAHILYDKRVDGKKMQRPNTNGIVNLNLLKELKNEKNDT